MKKFLLMFFVLAGIVSCTKQTTELSQSEITFKNSVVQKVMTKANKGIIENNEFSYDDFGAYGYVTPNNDAINGENNTTNGGYVIKNGKYVKNGNVWKPESGSYYWPKADVVSDINVNFVAYAPWQDIEEVNDVLKVPIVANAMGINCVDVLYAHTATAVNPTSNPVPLTFTHALSWIEFQGKFAKSVKSVTITSIKFSNTFKSEANMVLNVKNFAEPTFEDLDVDIDPNFCNKALLVQDEGDGSTEYEILSDMLLIPQDVPSQITITFNITIQNTDSDEIHYNGRTVTRTINGGPDANKQYDSGKGRNFVDKFESGKKYIYRVYVTADEITFNVDVDDWDDANNPFQIWDHNTTAYVEHFFGKASMLMVKNSAIA